MNLFKKNNCSGSVARALGAPGRGLGRRRARLRGPYALRASRGWCRMSLDTFLGCLPPLQVPKSVHTSLRGLPNTKNQRGAPCSWAVVRVLEGVQISQNRDLKLKKCFFPKLFGMLLDHSEHA